MKRSRGIFSLVLAGLLAVSVCIPGAWAAPVEGHTHTELCGYVEARDEIGCSCTENGEGQLIHTEGCGYQAAVPGHACAVETAVDAIALLPEADAVTAESQALIAAARAAYDAVPESIRGDVTNAPRLTAAEAALAALSSGGGNPAPEAAAAQIGTETYATLEAAIQAALADTADRVEISLLADCGMEDVHFWGNTQTLDKTIVLRGGGHTITLKRVTLGLSGTGNLTFDNCSVLMTNDGADSYNITMQSGAVLSLVNGTSFTIDGTEKNGGIYTYGGAAINIDAASLIIRNTGDTALMNQSGSVYYAQLNISNGSKFLIDTVNGGNGLTTFDVTVQGSSFGITNIPRNKATVQSKLTFKNADVDVSNCWMGFTSCGEVSVLESSTVDITNIGSCSIYLYQDTPGSHLLHVDGTSGLSITNTGAYHTTTTRNALYANCILLPWTTCHATFDDGARVTIANNAIRGILNYGIVSLGSGTVISNNTAVQCSDADPSYASNGGGIINLYSTAGGIEHVGTIIMHAGAVVCNNHASVSGDDIYSAAQAKLTLVPAAGFHAVLDDCGHAITGWYYDGVKAGEDTARWNVVTAMGSHCNGETDAYQDEYAIVAGDTGFNALKAAHGAVDDTPYIPSYPVSYVYEGEVPVDASALPAARNYTAGNGVTVAADAVTALEGWSFNGWTTADVTVTEGRFTMPGRAVTLVGTWTFIQPVPSEEPTPTPTTIPDDEMPTGDQPEPSAPVTAPEAQQPAGGVDIPDDEAPLAAAPKTGDGADLAALWVLLGLGLSGLAVCVVLGLRRRRTGK